MEAQGPDLVIGTTPISAEQEARGMRLSQAYRALAFADARRAARLSPRWAKAHGRLGEAAREIGLASLATGDEHGVVVMKACAVDAFRAAAELQPSDGGFAEAAVRVEKELSADANG